MRKCLIAASVAALLIPGAAVAASPGTGESIDAPGRTRALANCGNVIERQFEKLVAAGGGPKAGQFAPANCDHFYQFVGDIGNVPGGED